ncbi:hypothetical protein ACH9L7_08750 [Haloferax sp. S1W]|uniref:DUF7314 family protein n=1 Tax=Haloferax sp. S1W TaxID=3377110 RepID=UPI0037CAB459
MADEFIKGLGILTGSGLAWMVLASWYRTSSFESTKQLIEPLGSGAPEGIFNLMGVILMDVFLWFALLGALTFWVLIPAGRQVMAALQERQNA